MNKKQTKKTGEISYNSLLTSTVISYNCGLCDFSSKEHHIIIIHLAQEHKMKDILATYEHP